MELDPKSSFPPWAPIYGALVGLESWCVKSLGGNQLLELHHPLRISHFAYSHLSTATSTTNLRLVGKQQDSVKSIQATYY